VFTNRHRSPVFYFLLGLGFLAAAGLVVRFLLLAVVLLGGSIYFMVKAFQKVRKDPYDLSELRELHERELLRDQMMEEPPNSSHVIYCPFCSTVYREDMKVCPHCGRSANV
jgi:hypothetical protein